MGAQLQIAAEAIRAWRGEAARARLRGQLAGLWRMPRWFFKRRLVKHKAQVTSAYIESLLTGK